MTTRLEWVFLAYRLPREPSTPRIALWRKLRRLGAVQVLDGLVALPLDARTREQLEWAADEVIEAEGEATVWLARAASVGQERELVGRMAAAVAEEYRALIAEAQEGVADKRTLARLRRELRAVRARDFFPPPEAEQARWALETAAVGVG